MRQNGTLFQGGDWGKVEGKALEEKEREETKNIVSGSREATGSCLPKLYEGHTTFYLREARDLRRE